MAWDEVCAPTEKGGLGFRCLCTHNSCLLLKHLLKVHSPGSAPWEQRFSASYGWSPFRNLGDVNSDSTVWKDIASGLDFLRSISKVTVGNGESTAFWLDLWIGQETLASRFPALFSHSLRPNISVSSAISSLASLSTFRPRLSNMALNELGDLQILVSTVVLNLQAVDVRVGRLDGKALSTSSAYSAAFAPKADDHAAPAIWNNFATNKCRIFLWLANKNRLFSNDRRFRRGLATSAKCPFCDLDETATHMLLHCESIRPLWDALQSVHPD